MTTRIVGVPHLAVEILSPTDTREGATNRLALYRRPAVTLVWMVDPYQQTVTVHARGSRPRLMAVGDELACEPHLSGFRVSVSRLFA